MVVSQHLLVAPVNIIDKIPMPARMALLLFGLAITSATGALSADSRLPPVLVDHEDNAIGIFTGTTRSYDLDGVASNAFEVVSPSGYLAAVLPDGRLGAVRQLYFETDACHGPARVAARPSSTQEGLLVPGYVFAFGQPASIYFISKNAAAHEFTPKSVLLAGAEGVNCSEDDTSGLFYAAEDRLTYITASLRLDYGSVSIQTSLPALPVESEAKPSSKSLDNGPARSKLYQPGMQSCAPGCEQGYIVNGTCDSECNNAACGFDQGDCQD